jgi:hypothetical protein
MPVCDTCAKPGKTGAYGAGGGRTWAAWVTATSPTSFCCAARGCMGGSAVSEAAAVAWVGVDMVGKIMDAQTFKGFPETFNSTPEKCL